MGVTIVSLDGIPGAGKSKLLRELKSRLHGISSQNIICLQEPVEEWSKLKDTHGNTLFSLYYNDQKRYALAFQLQVLHTRFELFEETIRENPDSLIITERDLITDYRIFTQMLYDSGMFEEIEFKLYQELFNSYQRRLCELCSGSDDGRQNLGAQKRIYLTTSAGVAHKRMRMRGRKEEEGVPLSYLERVDEYHQNAFADRDNILKLEGDDDWVSLPESKLELILDFLFED